VELLMLRFHTTRRVMTACLLAFVSASPAAAQTWTGATSNQWNTASNWSSGSVPVSGVNTQLIFGAATSTSLQNNIPGTLSLNRMTFDAGAPAYTISGNALNFVTSTSSVNPFIFQNSANPVTIGSNLVLTDRLTIDGTGVGVVTLSGTLSGAGGLDVSGAGMVVLGNGSNSFGGDVEVTSGTLSITSPNAIPGGRSVSVRQGAEFRIHPLLSGNNAAAPIGLLGLSGGTFRAQSASAEYYVEQLSVLESGGVPAAINFSGSTNFRLHLTGTVGGIIVGGNTTWTGGGTSSIQNDRSSAIQIVTGSTITNGIRLLNGTSGMGFQLTGGGTMVLTSSGNTAHLEVDGSTLEVADMAYLGTGVTVLRRTAGSDPGTLKYTGATATSSKQLMLGPGHSRIWVANSATDLTLSGTISDAASGLALVVAGDGTLTLTGTNTFNRPIFVRDGGVLSVPALPNGGVAGPLGVSGNNPGSLVLGFGSATGTLRYTGGTATTDRGIHFGSGTVGILEVTNPLANLSVTGQIVGGTVTKTGPGTLTLGSALNDFSGGVSIQGGALAISRPTAVPADADVAVGPGAEFRLAFSTGSNTAGPIGAVTLNNGTFAVPLGPSEYHINRLVQETGGRVDFTGSSNFLLRLKGAGAGINVTGNSTWVGAVASSILNDTATPLDISITPGTTLTSSIRLMDGISGQGFRLTGGGTLVVTNTNNIASLTVAGSTTLQIGSATALGSLTGTLTLDGGTFAYTGPPGASFKPLVLGPGGGTLSITNAATSLNWTTPIQGGYTLTKTGPGSVWLNNGANVLGGLVIDGGRVDVSIDSALGTGPVVVNPAGTLRFTGSATTARTFALNGGTLEVPTGVTLTLNGAAVNGGFLANTGTGKYVLTNSAAVNGATLFGGTTVDATGPAAFTNVTTGANVTVANGQTLTLTRGLQTAAGTLTVNGSVSAPQGWESTGVLRITGGTNPGQMTVGGSSLVLGGGSRTFVGANATGQRGGTILLGGRTLELNGGLLVNNGDFIAANNGGIQQGTVNVNFGSLAKGSGYYEAVNVTDGGKFAPGNSIADSFLGSVTFNSGSLYEFEINKATGLPGGGGTTPPQGWDRLTLGLSMTVNSTPQSPAIIQLVTRNPEDTTLGNLTDFDRDQSYRWEAFRAETFPGFSPDKFTFDTSQFLNLTNPAGVGTFALERTGSSVFITYTPVPEPGLMLAVAAAGLAVGGVVRRRFHRAAPEVERG
jgi:fibronectin-binding autotransporter adhesin